jgi:hypothetical protein
VGLDKVAKQRNEEENQILMLARHRHRNHLPVNPLRPGAVGSRGEELFIGHLRGRRRGNCFCRWFSFDLWRHGDHLGGMLTEAAAAGNQVAGRLLPPLGPLQSRFVAEMLDN